MFSILFRSRCACRRAKKEFFSNLLGNATLIHTGRLVYPEDIRAVAKAMQVEEGGIAALQPLDWIEKDTQTGKRRAGRVVF